MSRFRLTTLPCSCSLTSPPNVNLIVAHPIRTVNHYLTLHCYCYIKRNLYSDVMSLLGLQYGAVVFTLNPVCYLLHLLAELHYVVIQKVAPSIAYLNEMIYNIEGCERNIY